MAFRVLLNRYQIVYLKRALTAEVSPSGATIAAGLRAESTFSVDDVNVVIVALGRMPVPNNFGLKSNSIEQLSLDTLKGMFQELLEDVDGNAKLVHGFAG